MANDLKEPDRIEWLHKLSQALRRQPAKGSHPLTSVLQKEMLEPVARGLESWSYGDRFLGPKANAPLVNERTMDMAAAAPIGALGKIGPTAKASLLLPAMLSNESKVVQELNRKIIPMHAASMNNFSGPLPHSPKGPPLPQRLNSPSFSLYDRKNAEPFGNPDLGELDLDPDELQSMYRNIVLVGKPGALDPERRVGRIFYGDAGSSTISGKHAPLSELEDTLRSDIRSNNDNGLYKGMKGQAQWPSFMKMLRDPTVQNSADHFKELKLYGNLPVHPDNFSGAVVSPKHGEREIEAVLKQLRNRKIPYTIGSVDDPEALWGMANELQKRSVK